MMTTPPRILKCALVFLTLLAAHGVSTGQSLSDVVLSLSDRQRVISQQNQVNTYLNNQNNNPTDTDADLPADNPIDWLGAGTNPTQSSVDGLDIGGKIALLNQAVAEFDRLKFAFLNSSPGEFESGGTVGVLKPHTSGDFEPLPRATPENYHELLRLLAQRVRSLRLIQWPAAFRQKTLTDQTNVREVVVYDDPQDSNNDHNYQPRVEIHDQDDAVVESVTWKPDSIGPGNLDVEVSEPWTTVISYLDSRIHVYGGYSEDPSGDDAITAPLRWQWLQLSGTYPEEARVSATAPGGAGTQIGGAVYVLRRSHWHQIDIDGASSRYEENEAGYVVEGSSSSGTVSLFGSPPSATVNGSWLTTWEYSDEYGDYLDQTFVEGGYQYKEAWTLPSYDEGHSNDYNNSYEQNWNIGCTFYPVFKPTFTRGVDAAGMRAKLESADGVLADNAADGNLLLHPRPSLLFGIDLGPGLKGGGNGYVSTSTMETGWYGYYGYYGWSWDDWTSMMRFDSSYSLQFAGSCSDYHVVYENDRSNRTQSLPADSMGWPYTDSGNVARHDTLTLYRAWDRPRLKQVAGRDLVADITYNANHYGGYTVKIYRRPTGSAAPTPGQAMDITGMTLVRTWTFSHAGGSTAHPTNAEKLEVAGSGGEKYEIQANEVLPNQGLGWAYWYYYSYDWWWWTEGTHSWTLKLSQGTTEKLKKEIEVTTSTDENESSVWDIALRESVDGQLVSSLASTTLNPFNDAFPADWTITSAGKTITGSGTLGNYQDRATRYGTLPTAASIQYDGIQPDVNSTWNASGLLSSFTQGPWSIAGMVQAGAYKQTHKLNNSTVSTDWIELSEGGNKVKTSSSADGTSGAPVIWTEVEYGTATTGLPGLPHIVRSSDGSGATYQWGWISPSNENQLTLTEGLISGNSVSRGSRIVRNTNERGHPTGYESFLINGGTIQTGGSVLSVPTAWGAPTRSTDYNTGLDSTWSYDSNLSRLSARTGSLGVVSEFSGYDALGRATASSSNGINASIEYTALTTKATIGGNATGLLTDTRDNFGRLTSSNHTWNGVTDNLTLAHSETSEVITRQNLLGTHQATHRRNDGTLASASGPTQAFGGNDGTAFSVDNGLLKSTSRIASQTATYQTTWTDAWGRIRKTETSKGTTEYLYSAATSSLQRVRATEPGGHKNITESDPYNTAGAITRSGIDVDKDGSLGVSDRYVESVTTVSGGNLVTTLSLAEDDGLREVLRTTWNPVGNQTVTKINRIGTTNVYEETITRTPGYFTKTVTTTSSKGWSKTESFNNLGLTTNCNLTGTGVPAGTLTPVWRADGSLSEVTFTAGGDTHSATFKNDGTLATLNAPGKGNILGSHTISDGVETLTVDGVTTAGKLDGTQVATSGGDLIGKTETLAVSGGGFQKTIDPVVGANTTSDFNSAGAPTAKSYAAGSGESYTHTPGGLLEKITLARGGDLIFGYSPDGAKDLVSASWPTVSSGLFVIPAIAQSYGHDRAGRVDEIGDSSGARSLVYQNGRLKQTAWNSGALASYKVVKGLDTTGRDTGFELWRGNVLIHSAQKAPNGVSGEVSELASGNLKIAVGRNAARQITGFEWGNASGTFVPTVTQTWDRGVAGRILSATSNVTGAPSFNYKGTANNEATAFDAKGRRLKCVTAGGESTYQYTNGRLTSAVHPTHGTFSYGFDGIGRRTDMGSANTGDLLNRTLAWTNSQRKTVRVAAAPAAQLWFNGSPVSNFTGSYNYSVPSPGASGGWFAWNTLAVLPGQGDAGANPDAKAEQSGAVWIPPVSESFTYDAAGNRESSALWDYGWDAKNNLVRSRTKNHNSAVQGYDINNAFNAENRRFSKKVNRYQNGSIVEQKIITFLHDGDDIIYERHQLPSGLTICERKYVWGSDISGTHGGAGGAGGLLLIRETKGNSTIDLNPLYDGSGNVVALADSAGNLQAEYGYTPFGELLYARGTHAQSCPFRFATKYFDQETGLCDFGRRFYDSVTGQFLSREPLGEKESLNLYDYGHGDPINNVDVQGLASVSISGSLSTTLETLIPILTSSPFDDINSNSGVGNTVAVPDTPLDVINLALVAIAVEANALPIPETDFSADRSYQIWMMTASPKQLTEAAHSGRFSAAISKEFMKQSQASSNAAMDYNILSGTAQGVTFIAQPEAVAFKAMGVAFLAVKGLRAASGLAKAGEEAFELGFVAKGTDFLVGGRLGGELYDAGKLTQLETYLGKRGVTLRVGDDFVPPGKAGGFAQDGSSLLLRSNPTQYEVWHELSHFRQFQKLGSEAYQALPRTNALNAPEQFVFDLLENSPKRWNGLNFQEQQHAIRYIERIGGFR